MIKKSLLILITISILILLYLFAVGKLPFRTSSSTTGQTLSHSIDHSNEPYQEGKHYQKLNATIITHPLVQELVSKDPEKIQVVEFFNYACFWCQRLHPRINHWLERKPKEVIIYRYPIVFNKSWEVMAKAYLMVKTLGKTETLDPVFFKALHEDKIDLTNEKTLEQFFAQHGIDSKQFSEMYGSFSINRSLTSANELANAYQLTASPAMVINGPNGSYLVTASMAGSEAAVLAVVEYLVAKESKTLAR